MPKAQQTYDLLLKTVGCATGPDPVACLEGKAAYELTKFGARGGIN